MSFRKLAVVGLVVASVIAVSPASFAAIVDADLSITKTDGVTSVIAGESVVYTIVVTNAGPADMTGGTVTDTMPTVLSCNWTCVASAGSSCTAAGSGDIGDSVDLLAGGTATYTATCSVDPDAFGDLANTASVASALNDPNVVDNSATDVTTITQRSVMEIPTTSETALALLALLLVGAGLWTLRR